MQPRRRSWRLWLVAACAVVGAACAPSNPQVDDTAERVPPTEQIQNRDAPASTSSTSTTLPPGVVAYLEEVERAEASEREQAQAMSEFFDLIAQQERERQEQQALTNCLQAVERAEQQAQAAAAQCPAGSYVNTYGNTVCRPYRAPSAPPGASARCSDDTYSYSQSRQGTCSSHGGVAAWL